MRYDAEFTLFGIELDSGDCPVEDDAKVGRKLGCHLSSCTSAAAAAALGLHLRRHNFIPLLLLLYLPHSSHVHIVQQPNNLEHQIPHRTTAYRQAGGTGCISDGGPDGNEFDLDPQHVTRGVHLIIVVTRAICCSQSPFHGWFLSRIKAGNFII